MIYRVRIILDAQENAIRDIEIEPTSTLEDLHNAIVQTFGFEGREIASFYTCDADWNQEEEIALFDMSEDGSDTRLMNQTFLEDVLTEQSPNLIYVYDFLNMWTFLVELADMVDREDGKAYPNLRFSFGVLPDTLSEKKFSTESGSLDFDDLNFDDS